MTFAPSNSEQCLAHNDNPETPSRIISSKMGTSGPNQIAPTSTPNEVKHVTLGSEYKHGSDVARGLRWARCIDIILSAVAIIILLPVLALMSLAIWMHDGGPPIFAHRRIGKAGKTFPCLKFRTMVTNAEQRLADILRSDPDAAQEWKLYQKLRVDPRITPIGNLLRKTSLDELPQLFNVLIGHMSLVGPRPIVENEIPHYGRYFVHYCGVRPGITGLWQVSGRSDVSYRRRVVMDTVYCRSRSLTLDLSIMARTIPAVLMSRGAA